MNEKELTEKIANLEARLESIKAQGNYIAGQIDILKQLKNELAAEKPQEQAA